MDKFCPFGQRRQIPTLGNGISNCMASLDLEIADEQGLELRQAVAASLTDLTRKIMITAMVALVMDMECPFQGLVRAQALGMVMDPRDYLNMAAMAVVD